MATSRLRNRQTLSYENIESDGDTEPEPEHTPRPGATTARTLSKKRLSERVDPDGDFSPDTSISGGANPRQPFKSVNINDDIAEKRRRRKSAKIALPDLDDAEAASSSALNPSDNTDGVSEGPRTSNLNRQKSSLLAVPQAPVINVSMDVMTSNFDQWMKMATDNKINAANSWNFALIDYFHDMSLLRNNTDNSINFQRASCTLDGCVKIWTSRVDSVGAETGKLLSNLANGDRDDDDEESNDSDNPASGDPSQSQRKRKAYRSESTLAKNAAQLRTKKLELEFSVDPLFRKTCADFDEGGAQGLLMNHLGLTVTPDGHLRVVFDASDSVAKDEDEEQPLEEPRDEVDLSGLRENFMINLEQIDEQEISASLEDFAFGKDTFSVDDTAFFRDGTRALDDDDDDGNDGFGDVQDFDDAMDVDGISSAAVPVQDFFIGEQAVPDADADYGGDGDNASVNGSDGAPTESKQAGFVPFDPRRVTNERHIRMAINDSDSEGMLNYFDPAFLRNWAGPEHWKLRKVVRRPDAAEAAAARPKREKKEAFKIDFLTAAEEDLKTRQKKLFAPVTRGAGINLPGPSAFKTAKKGGKGRKRKSKDKEEKRNDQTLPDDMHFSSKQLVTLFLKPKFLLKMRGQQVWPEGAINGDIDDAFWARAAQKAGSAADETADGGAIPFATQFFHDHDEFDDDGAGFDEGGSVALVDAGEQDLLISTQGQSRRVKPEAVNYTKRAKRVDVRRLKENIWKGLDIVAPAVEDSTDAMDIDDRRPTAPNDGRSFTTVISDLHKSYPKDKMDEISTSFCFICLLHLANERGLKLEVEDKVEDDDMMRGQVENLKVGKLWDLKVYRDPNATPAS